MIAYIYKVTHVNSGRVYVGQTSNRHGDPPRYRWSSHISAARRGSSTHFHNAIRKYGPNAFVFEIIEECTKENANDRERFHILQYSSNQKKFGFNMSDGGDGGQNVVSVEVRAKISASKKGISQGPHSKETIEKIRQSKLGIPRSEECIKKMKESRAKSVQTLTPEWRRNLSNVRRANAKYKLTAAQVMEISVSGETDSVLSRKFGVSRKLIWRIRKGIYIGPGGKPHKEFLCD